MRRIQTTDALAFIVIALYLVNLNLDDMNTLSWIGFSVSIIYLVVFIVKHLIPEKKGTKK